jgi:hypothetical protein
VSLASFNASQTEIRKVVEEVNGVLFQGQHGAIPKGLRETQKFVFDVVKEVCQFDHVVPYTLLIGLVPSVE